jgi:hypothetical protein
MLKHLLFAFAAMVISSSGMACEKWKSELAKLAWNLGGYAKAYHSYETKADDVMHHQLMNKSRDVVKVMDDLAQYANSEPSCSGDDVYEKRRQLLLSAISKARPIVIGAKYLAPAIKEKLDAHR